MDFNTIKSSLLSLAASTTGCAVVNYIPLPKSGSSRQYFRLFMANSSTLIGTYSSNVVENRAFVYLAGHFAGCGLNVPKIVAVSSCERFYLQSDLGGTSLFNIITEAGKYPNYRVESLVKTALLNLVSFQVDGANGLDCNMLYPIPRFDRHSVMWDLNYFKYNFLKAVNANLDEVALEADFERLSDYLLNDDLSFFQYRDFQSRNVMVAGADLYYIDFQGGRLGPCLYDVASFLYQAKAGFSNGFRAKMLIFYLQKLAERRRIDEVEMCERFNAIVAFRIVQTLGAYGFRGFFEHKPHFVQSISAALSNLTEVLPRLPKGLVPYIEVAIGGANVDMLRVAAADTFEGLTVHVCSFSLKQGYPPVNPDHGGGYVFDCRALPNPGRYDRYKSMNGLDAEVVSFLEQSSEVSTFMGHVESIVASSVISYKERGFKYLSVAFGCTGGQHRSVYCANQLAHKLESIPGISVKVAHIELGL